MKGHHLLKKGAAFLKSGSLFGFDLPDFRRWLWETGFGAYLLWSDEHPISSDVYPASLDEETHSWDGYPAKADAHQIWLDEHPTKVDGPQLWSLLYRMKIGKHRNSSDKEGFWCDKERTKKGSYLTQLGSYLFCFHAYLIWFVAYLFSSDKEETEKGSTLIPFRALFSRVIPRL